MFEDLVRSNTRATFPGVGVNMSEIPVSFIAGCINSKNVVAAAKYDIYL